MPTSTSKPRSMAQAVVVLLIIAFGPTAGAQNLHVAGKVGVATTSPSLPLHVATCHGQVDCTASDVSLTGGGYLMLGDQSDRNLTFDNNEIMSRHNGAPHNIYINQDGGNVYLSKLAGTTIIGDGTTSRKRPLWILGGRDINFNDVDDGFIQAGANSGPNLVIDQNEIMARNGSGSGASPATLYLNYYTNGVVRVRSLIQVSSDRRLKRDIEPITNSLAKITALSGVTWRWRKGAKEGPRSMGIIAQDVEKSFPEIVSVDPEDGTKAVQYEALIGPLIEAVKELKADNDGLRAEIESLRRTVQKARVKK